MKNLYSFLIVFFFTALCANPQANSAVGGCRLWFPQSAKEWTEALPVGNGRLGAMVVGGVQSERIQLNEESLWAGQPIDNNNPGALKNLAKNQRLLPDGKIDQAMKLSEKHLLGTPPRIHSYQTL